MTTEEFIQHIEDTYKRGVTIIRAKNHDYAGEGDPFKNFKYAEMVGVPVERGMLVRIMDKISRINQLLDKEGKVTDESLQDSLLDTINYLAILLAYLEDRD